MDDWGFEQLERWLKICESMPVGPLFCVISGRTCGRAWPPSAPVLISAGAGPRLRPAALRAAPAAACPRARGRAAQRHPAPNSDTAISA